MSFSDTLYPPNHHNINLSSFTSASPNFSDERSFRLSLAFYLVFIGLKRNPLQLKNRSEKTCVSNLDDAAIGLNVNFHKVDVFEESGMEHKNWTLVDFSDWLNHRLRSLPLFRTPSSSSTSDVIPLHSKVQKCVSDWIRLGSSLNISITSPSSSCSSSSSSSNCFSWRCQQTASATSLLLADPSSSTEHSMLLMKVVALWTKSVILLLTEMETSNQTVHDDDKLLLRTESDFNLHIGGLVAALQMVLRHSSLFFLVCREIIDWLSVLRWNGNERREITKEMKEMKVAFQEDEEDETEERRQFLVRDVDGKGNMGTAADYSDLWIDTEAESVFNEKNAVDHNHVSLSLFSSVYLCRLVEQAIDYHVITGFFRMSMMSEGLQKDNITTHRSHLSRSQNYFNVHWVLETLGLTSWREKIWQQQELVGRDAKANDGNFSAVMDSVYFILDHWIEKIRLKLERCH